MMEENHLSKYQPLEVKRAQIRSLSLLSKKLGRKKWLITLGSIFCTLGICLKAGWTVFSWQFPVMYESGLIEVQAIETGGVEITLNKENYHEGNIATRVIERNSKKQSIMIIYYTDTVWIKYGPNSEGDVSDKYKMTPTTATDD